MKRTPTWEWLVRAAQPLPLSELEIIVAKGQPLTFDLQRADIQNEILRYWDEKQVEMTLVRAAELAEALQQGDKEKVGRMQKQIGGVSQKHRCSSAVLQDKKLYLALSSTDYMTFTGTNVRAITDPAFRERLMHAGLQDFADPNYYFANPLGLGTVLYGVNDREDSRNIYTAIGLRSEKVMLYPNTHHTFGGFIDVLDEGRKVSFHSELLRELQEEVGLPAELIGVPLFKGIVRHKPSRHPEVICEIPVYISQEKLQERWRQKAPGKFEHNNLSFFSLRELPDFLQKHGPTMVPAGAAGLYEFLRHHAPELIGKSGFIDGSEQHLYN